MAIDERLVKALHVEVLRRRQRKPYRPLVEVVQDQHVFDFTDVEGTLVGFRFPTTRRASRFRATTCTSSAQTAPAAATSSTVASATAPR